MQREIKFRTWNKNEQKMEQVFGLDWTDKKNTEDEPEHRFTDKIQSYLCDAPLVNGEDEYRKVWWEDRYEYDLMRFTGLKDKNGKEIYEGDICKAPHDFGPGGFSERTFAVAWHNELGYQWNYWDLSKLEVIGNIYENPDLLKQYVHHLR